VSASLLEIVDLGDGEVVLRRAEEGSEPVVTIRFSETTQYYLMDNCMEIAKVMIQAGIEAAAAILAEEDEEIDQSEEAPRTVH